MSNIKVLKEKSLEKEREQTENRYTKILWFGHENLRPYTKALDGYIFTIFLDSYNETQAGYIY
jgi:hypothetical protein